MQTWQTRLVEEKRQLDERIQKLDAFLQGPYFKSVSEIDRYLLAGQFDAMQSYSRILGQRIDRFS